MLANWPAIEVDCDATVVDCVATLVDNRAILVLMLFKIDVLVDPIWVSVYDLAPASVACAVVPTWLLVSA